MFLIYALLGTIGFGTSNLLASYATKYAGHIKGMLWSTISIFMFLIIIAKLFNITFDLKLLGLSLLIEIVAAGILQTLGGLAFYKGTEKGSISILSTIASAYSIVIVLISVLFRGEHLNSQQLLSIILIIIGTIIISVNIKDILNLKMVVKDKSIPYGLFAMFAWGVGFVFIGDATKSLGWMQSNMYMTVVSVLFLVVVTLKKEKKFYIVGRNAYISCFVLGIFSTMGYIGYSLGITSSYASIVGPIVAAAPIVTSLLAVLFLKDKIQKIQLTGMALIILGVILLSI